MPTDVEGVILSDYTMAVTAWLDLCFHYMESGHEELIPLDVMSTVRISDEVIDRVVNAIEEEFVFEIRNEHGRKYHMDRSGCDQAPEFTRLSARGRRAMVEGLEALRQRYPVPEAVGHYHDDYWDYD